LDPILDFFRELRYRPDLREALYLSGYMLLGGLLGLYVRGLYLRFSSTVSNRERFSNIFPLLTVATTLVIFVVKAKLALSLGLVGALSIVRFRAAIKEPEEIIYLFFCITLGVALGAEYLEFAVAGAIIFSLFAYLRKRPLRKDAGHAMLLTIAGQTKDLFDGDSSKIGELLDETSKRHAIQRLDIEEGHVQVRATIWIEQAQQMASVAGNLQAKLPSCRVSFVNLENVL